MKYTAMAGDAFAFFRGTCHLFWEDWSHPRALERAPLAWICGDLHLQNFGTFRGDNRLTYFDINDFDDATLAPCTYDAVRLATSILLAGAEVRVPAPRLGALAATFVDAYAGALARGRAGWIERDTARGMVRRLLQSLERRKRVMLLDKRTYRRGNRRRILLDGQHALPASRVDRRKVLGLLAQLPEDITRPKRFYAVRDVARRVSGIGSLGVERYVVLIEGMGSPDRNYLLDVKRALPSAVRAALRGRPPRFASEADRVIAVQHRLQAVSPALLHPLTHGEETFVLRELGPREDRVPLRTADGRRKPLEGVVRTMGCVLAWDHLRASGRQGAAVADALIAFGRDRTWRRQLLAYARRYAARVRADHQTFRRAWRRVAAPALTPGAVRRSRPVASG